MIDVDKTLKTAVETYGAEKQTDMMIEEMSELSKALLKHRRNATPETVDNVLEEMADVQIMLDQMRLIYGDDTGNRAEKILRLAARLGTEKADEVRTPKKVKGEVGYNAIFWYCPNCGKALVAKVYRMKENGERPEICPYCQQLLYWGGEPEGEEADKLMRKQVPPAYE